MIDFPLSDVIPSPIVSVDVSPWVGFAASISIYRDELNHHVVSGNKLRKLKYPLQQALKMKYIGITSFGGAHSNHAHALAYACKKTNLGCRLIIRGEEASSAQSPTLADCQQWGAEIIPVSRADYRQRHNHKYQQSCLAAGHMLLPEGGSAKLALTGVAEVLDNRTRSFPYIATAVGSGGTAAGLATSLEPHQKLLVVPAVRDTSLPKRIDELLSHYPVNTQIGWLNGYEWGGFGKFPSALARFTEEFYVHTTILLDPIYTAKLAYAVIEQIRQGHIPANNQLLLYHSGGLQGWRARREPLSKSFTETLDYVANSH